MDLQQWRLWKGQDVGDGDDNVPPPKHSGRITENLRQRAQDATANQPQTRLPLQSARIATLQNQATNNVPRQCTEWKLKAKLRPFDGTSEDPMQWSRHAICIFDLSSVTDEALRIQLAISSFISVASVWVDTALSDDVVSWAEFKHQLVRHFRPTSGFENKMTNLV